MSISVSGPMISRTSPPEQKLPASPAMTTARTGRDGEQALARMAPLGRLVEPEEVAFAVAFFAAREAGAINGQTVVLDGGGVQA